MSLLDTLKSLFGLGSKDRKERRARDVGVTVEREPDAAEPSAETEHEVKGTDAASDVADEGTTDVEPPSPPTSTESTGGTAGSGTAAAEAATAGSADAETEPTDAETEPTDAETEPTDAGTEPDGEAADAETEATDEAAGDSGDGPPAPSPEAADESTDVVKGIGPSYAERLAEAGVETVGDLAGADPDALAEETGISEKRLGRWVERARHR